MCEYDSRSWGGERVGVRGKPVEWTSAPHPTPLPVKNGEREQTEFFASWSHITGTRCRIA